VRSRGAAFRSQGGFEHPDAEAAAHIVGLGLVLAAVLAVPTLRWLQNQFFGVGPGAFGALFAVAVLVSGAAGMIAAFWPARRAARVAPLQALRHE
jgi:ABC-type antimicrobial peptide transport system permease subunit